MSANFREKFIVLLRTFDIFPLKSGGIFRILVVFTYSCYPYRPLSKLLSVNLDDAYSED